MQMTSASWVPFGFLPVYKPEGPTSHDVVAAVRKLLPRSVKVGHTGTLDPFARGVLLLALGKATKFTDAVHRLSKTYAAQVRLGIQTNTLDPTGEVDKELPIQAFDDAQLKRVAGQFTGRFPQVPPVFSAKRVGGKKSYELARKNQAVTLAPKEIEVFTMALRRTDEQTLRLVTTCATGTYVRALGKDIAEALGTCGHLLDLERSGVGPVEAEHCVRLEELTAENLPEYVLPVSKLLPEYPEVALPRAAYSYFIDGRRFRCPEPLPSQFLAKFELNDGRVAAIFRCEYHAEDQLVSPRLLCYLNPDVEK